jgi:hypothetical protein
MDHFIVSTLAENYSKLPKTSQNRFYRFVHVFAAGTVDDLMEKQVRILINQKAIEAPGDKKDDGNFGMS